MKKENIIICALITCLLTIIIMGSIQDNKKAGNSKDNTNKYTEKIEQLEKENEELKKQYEDYDKKLENTNLSKEDYKKKLDQLWNNNEKLNEVLKNIDSKNSEYQSTVENIMEKFFEYSPKYCGETSKELEKIEDPSILDGSYSGGYVKSYTFNNMEEVKSFYKEFLSDEYFNNRIKKYYVEKDNEVYCYNIGKETLQYEPSKSMFKILSSTEDKIEIYYSIKEYLYNADDLRDSSGIATLINENGNWVVDGNWPIEYD